MEGQRGPHNNSRQPQSRSCQALTQTLGSPLSLRFPTLTMGWPHMLATSQDFHHLRPGAGEPVPPLCGRGPQHPVPALEGTDGPQAQSSLGKRFIYFFNKCGIHSDP